MTTTRIFSSPEDMGEMRHATMNTAAAERNVRMEWVLVGFGSHPVRVP